MNNITSDNVLNFFSTQSLSGFFVKAFSIVFALLFLTYAIVTYKQTQDITHTVQNGRNRFILLVSLLQVIAGLVLLVFAILFV